MNDPINSFLPIDEPADIIDALFDLLLNLASSLPEISKFESSSQASRPCATSSPNTRPTSSQSTKPAPDQSLSSKMNSLSCCCLLSLCVARGESGKLLTAISTLLMTLHQNSSQQIEVPAILIALQRNVHAILLGRSNRPDWLSHGFPSDSLCDSFHIDISASGRFPEDSNPNDMNERRSSAQDARRIIDEESILPSSSMTSASLPHSIHSSERVAQHPSFASAQYHNLHDHQSENSSHQSKDHFSLTFDGKFLYLYHEKCIYKFGSGFGGTVKGLLVKKKQLRQSDVSTSLSSYSPSPSTVTDPRQFQNAKIDRGWIGFAKDGIYLLKILPAMK